MADVAPDVQISGKIANIAAFEPQPTASVPEVGRVEIALCGYGSQIPRVGGEALFGRVTSWDASASSTGEFQAFLYSNGLIQPTGTYYTVTIRDSNGDIVQVEAYFFEPGSWDLSNMQPYDPGQPPPPLPPLIIPQLQIVPWSNSPVFEGSQYTAFKITLAADTTGAEMTNAVVGNLYTFIILQDATGGHVFWWPQGLNPMYNASYVDPTPNTYTIQTFVALDGGSLFAIGPGTYYTL